MRKLVASGTVLAILASPAFAAKQYWIVQQSTNSCTVVDEKPKSTVTTSATTRAMGVGLKPNARSRQQRAVLRSESTQRPCRHRPTPKRDYLTCLRDSSRNRA